MFCSNCGEKLSANALFCSQCGSAVNQAQTEIPAQTEKTNQAEKPVQTEIPKPQTVNIGYSSKINDSAFVSYKKKSGAWSLVFAVILAIIAMIGFPIYGNASGKIEWPNSFYYGAGIGAMFVVIALFQTLKKGFDKTWDGVVKSKNSYKKVDNTDDGYSKQYTVYVLKVKKDSGGTVTNKFTDTHVLYDYYNVGDKVRHHKGFYYYEKYDKSKDTQIMCAACMTLNDSNNEKCTKCKCPILK